MNYGTREADQPRPQQKRGGAGGRVAQERGTAHQLTNEERDLRDPSTSPSTCAARARIPDQPSHNIN